MPTIFSFFTLRSNNSFNSVSPFPNLFAAPNMSSSSANASSSPLPTGPSSSSSSTSSPHSFNSATASINTPLHSSTFLTTTPTTPSSQTPSTASHASHTTPVAARTSCLSASVTLLLPSSPFP